MTEEQQIKARLLAIQAGIEKVITARTAMTLANLIREQANEAPAYSEDAFVKLQLRLMSLQSICNDMIKFG